MNVRLLLIIGACMLNACARERSSNDDNAGADGGTQGDGGSPLDPAEQVDPNCTDGMYAETLPTGTESIADIAYTPGQNADYALAVLERRYPAGAHVVQGCIDNESEQQCVDMWILDPNDRSSAAGVIRWFNFIVHEGGHMYDLSQASGFGTYVLTEQTTLSCTGGDAVGRGGNTFARSELYSDAYQSEFAACPNQNAQNCDSYALIYLDPVQGNGASQGFDSVLEETTQYINSLAVGLAFRDQLPNGQITSARDGLLAFLWYIERYLHLARTENTAAYDYIINNACWRDAILTIWGRAWLYLEATKDMRNLEIYGDQFEAALLRPELLDEIARVRAAEGCE